jgi:hypothetical protein
MERIGTLVIVASVSLLLASCDGGGGGGGGSGTRITPISNQEDAALAVQSVSGVIDTVLESLVEGTYNDGVVDGISGTASVTGDYYHYSGVDCGVDCVQSWNDIDLAIVFTDYTALCADNAEATLSGIVTYTDNTWSQQQGQNYTSGGSVVMAGIDVSFYMLVWYEHTTKTWRYQDTISFEAGEEGYDGCCIPSNGVTYCF